VRVLEEAVGRPDVPMSTWAWLAPEERTAVLAAGTGRVCPAATGTVPAWIAAQVARRPAAVAVCDAHRSLTYATLDGAAQQLARGLRARGVGPEVRVAVCLERSVDLVVALLGVWLAGGAYVPIDPATPRERMAWLLADAGAAVIVTEAALRERVPCDDARVVTLPLAEQATGGEAQPLPVVHADTLAYVIYTSGSTGAPKGVLVTHRNLARLFSTAQDMFQFDEHDVWTMFHSAAFDFSVWELWGALSAGGRVVVVSRQEQQSPHDFLRLLLSERVTVLNQTPSAFRHFVPVAVASEAAQNLGLRVVIFGGEAVDVSQLTPWFERFGDSRPRLINMYGVTETTVHVTFRQLCERDTWTAWISPIGRPLPDLSTFVLDSHMRPVPRGVPGELYVGGAGVARGYLGRADLTAERFVPDPFSDGPGERLYRTGDRARLRADGELEYLGRVDHQLKVRGFRIECGEIEAVVASHPDVRECVVVGRSDHGGETQLAAYIEAAGADPPGPERLREWLAERLPEYMMPACFVFLSMFPRTTGGKIDRRALPAPRDDRPDLETEYVAPKGAMEEKIVALWGSVLHLKKVGVRDNFFSLGGNSLRLAHLHGLLETNLDTRFPMVTLFKHPTIRSFAEFLQTDRSTPTGAQRGHARARSRRESLGQQRLVERQERRAPRSGGRREA
jgi:amino acid adenylation domain-containing protein